MSKIVLENELADLSFSSILEALPQLEAGNLRPIAVYDDKRLEHFPEIPTFLESGYEAKVLSVRGIIAPKETPLEILQTLHDAFKEAMDTTEYQDFVKNGSGIPLYAGIEDSKELYKKLQKSYASVADAMQR